MTSNLPRESAWTGDRVALLTKLWADGLSCSEIATTMGQGLTRNAVIGKVHRLKLPRRREASPRLHRSNLQSRPRQKTPPKEKKPDRRFGNRAAFQPPPPKLPPIEPAAFTAGTWEPLPGSSPVSMEQLTATTCRWPLGDPYGPPTTLFCGCATVDGKSYCSEHLQRSIGKGTVVEQKAVKIARRVVSHERFVPERFAA